MNVNIDISNIELNTERLVLRPWKYSDLDDFYEYAKVDGVGQMAGWLPHKSKEESARILRHFIDGKKTFAIIYNNKAIGSLGIEEYNETALPELDNLRGRELGFVLSKDYWGKGLMAEAVKAVIEYLFNEVKLDFLVCEHFIENKQSCRVQEKCGFKHYKMAKYQTRYEEVKECWISLLYNQNRLESKTL